MRKGARSAEVESVNRKHGAFILFCRLHLSVALTRQYSAGAGELTGLAPLRVSRALGEGNTGGVEVFAPSAGFHGSLVSAYTGLAVRRLPGNLFRLTRLWPDTC